MRTKTLMKFHERMGLTPEIKQDLFAWNLELSPKMETIDARTLAPEDILGQGCTKSQYKSNNTDWGSPPLACVSSCPGHCDCDVSSAPHDCCPQQQGQTLRRHQDARPPAEADLQAVPPLLQLAQHSEGPRPLPVRSQARLPRG